MVTCSFDSCHSHVHAHGFCNKHYKRLRIHGNPSTMKLERHGKVGTPEYEAWHSMKQRCYNSNHKAYHNYGGRGIKVCDRWLESFEAFFEDMGKRPSPVHSLDRVDNNGDYSPKNCRWVCMDVQGNNRRTNLYITLNGTTKSLSQWSKGSTIPYDTLWRRVKDSEWPLEKALVTPIRGSK